MCSILAVKNQEFSLPLRSDLCLVLACLSNLILKAAHQVLSIPLKLQVTLPARSCSDQAAGLWPLQSYRYIKQERLLLVKDR